MGESKEESNMIQSVGECNRIGSKSGRQKKLPESSERGVNVN